MHEMCLMDELVPSIGTSVPSPSLLAVVISQSDSILQSVSKHFCDIHDKSSSSDKDFNIDFDNPFDFRDESDIISKTHLLSISDDGKIWNWRMVSQGPTDNPKVHVLDSKSHTETDDAKIGKRTTISPDKLTLKVLHQSHKLVFIISFTYTFRQIIILTQMSLVGQLHLLSSTVTMLAVPSPSLTATLASESEFIFIRR